MKYKEKRLETIQAAKQALEEREEELNPDKEIEDKKQISFADTDARIMGKQGDFDYRYNGQISVDSDHQIIVGQHLSQNANDKREIAPALENLREATDGRLPEKMSADNGYHSGDNLEALEGSGVDCYIATSKGEKRNETPLDESARKLVKADFVYDPEEDCFTCPGGQLLILIREMKNGEKTLTETKCPPTSISTFQNALFSNRNIWTISRTWSENPGMFSATKSFSTSPVRRFITLKCVPLCCGFPVLTDQMTPSMTNKSSGQ